MVEAVHYMDIDIHMKYATNDTNIFQLAAAGYSVSREVRGQSNQQNDSSLLVYNKISTGSMDQSLSTSLRRSVTDISPSGEVAFTKHLPHSTLPCFILSTPLVFHVGLSTWET